MKRIEIPVPTSEARRDRVEREVFARLEAMRDVDHANTMAPVPSRRLSVAVVGFAIAAAAAALVLLVTRESPSALPSSPSLVVVPAGGSSRFTVGDAVIDAGSDTSVEVKQLADGSTTLLLGRGSVDCDVVPRPDRPAFRVVAGDVTVEVVGTRFAVTRSGSVTRVDVTRGRVSVHGNGERRLLGPGDSWTSAVTTASAQAAQPSMEPNVDPAIQDPLPAEIEFLPEPMRPSHTTPAEATPRSPAEAFKAAQRLERSNPKKAAAAYRAIADGNANTHAAVALLALAELHARGDVDAALATLDELHRRFPNAANAEDAAWLRVDVLRDARRIAAAHHAAAAYLQEFPQGTYAKLAARLVRPSSP